VYLDDFTLEGKRFRSGDDLSRTDIEFFEKAGLKEVKVLYNEKLYSLLSSEFPLEYRKPYGNMDFIRMDRHLDVLNGVSGMSRRKRFVFVVGDVYGYDNVTGKKTVLATHNDAMDYKRWNDIKRFLNKDQRFSYRNCECAIIIFVNMKPDAETNFLERFKKNTDLVTALVARKKDSKVEIAPDFIPTEDVISVSDPETLLEIYRKSYAKLIIIGENISESYKRSLLQVKQYDKFARMMVVPSVNARDIDHFLQQVKLVYNSDRWSG
jgi:hypothetical protein